MPNIVKKIWISIRNKDTRILWVNFFSLSILQGATVVLPFLTFPYLTRVLGPTNFGLFNFAMSFIGYFVIITDYGFNLSGTKDISLVRDNPEKVNTIFNSIFFIKMLFAGVSLICVVLITASFPLFSQNFSIYIFSFGLVLGTVIFPVWFFQGTEKMKYISFLNLCGLFFYVLMVFLFIKNPSDTPLLVFFRCIYPVIIGCVSIFIIIKKFRIKLHFPARLEIIERLKTAFPFFISNVAVSLYTISNPFILRLLTQDINVGYFSTANSIISIAGGVILGPVSQTLYPRISLLASNSPENALKFIRKAGIIIAGITLLVSVGFFLFADTIILILAGDQYVESINVLKILSLIPFITGMSNLFGIQTMIPFGKKKAFMFILSFACLLNLVMSFILIPIFQEIGTALSILITESTVTVIMFVYLLFKKIKIVDFKKVPK